MEEDILKKLFNSIEVIDGKGLVKKYAKDSKRIKKIEKKFFKSFKKFVGEEE